MVPGCLHLGCSIGVVVAERQRRYPSAKKTRSAVPTGCVANLRPILLPYLIETSLRISSRNS
jgi:hypothetical protein